MLNIVAKLLFTATALAPVGLVYAYVLVRNSHHWIALAVVAAALALIFACHFLIKHVKKSGERSSFSISSVEAADRENIAFLLLYISPIITLNIDGVNWDYLIPIVIVFGVTVATGFNYHFSPLLGLMGWHFYKVGTSEGITYILLTKNRLRDTNKTFEVCQLTEYIVLDVGEPKK